MIATQSDYCYTSTDLRYMVSRYAVLGDLIVPCLYEKVFIMLNYGSIIAAVSFDFKV